MVIAGTPSHIDEIAAVLNRESWLGYNVVGALTPGTERAAETKSGVPIIGSCDGVTAIAEQARADVIFFA